MALHFERSEYAKRMQYLKTAMAQENLDAMLLFSQESMYWLTGYDTFGFCFFQCLEAYCIGTHICSKYWKIYPMDTMVI